MSPRPVRDICAECNQILPRAATARCPFCHGRVRSRTGTAGRICPRCDAPIPRAHRGKCPCTVAAAPPAPAAARAPGAR